MGTLGSALAQMARGGGNARPRMAKDAGSNSVIHPD
jgi:hypothetical protein